MGLLYEYEDELQYEKLIMTYNNKVIFEGYTDDLVTSIDGDLELKLNNVLTGKVSPVIGRKVNTSILWIPKQPNSYESSYFYQAVLFTKEDFYKLWSSLRYDATEDYQAIKNIDANELKLAWLASSNCELKLSEYTELSKSINSKLLAINSENHNVIQKFLKLLNESWSVTNLGREMITSEDSWKTMSVVLDLEGLPEWNAIKIDPNNNLYVHFGFNLCLEVLN
jgi:hypothetical protein